MRRFTTEDDIFKIRDKIVKAYLKMILRRFKRLNQGFITGFDEINILSAVNTTYEDVINMSVDALKKIAKQTYFWVCDDDFEADLWLSGFLQLYDPVTHYKWYDEADRKRSRAYEAIMSCRTSAERKKQIEVALKAWAKQFEQTADDVVVAFVRDDFENHVGFAKPASDELTFILLTSAKGEGEEGEKCDGNNLFHVSQNSYF